MYEGRKWGPSQCHVTCGHPEDDVNWEALQGKKTREAADSDTMEELIPSPPSTKRRQVTKDMASSWQKTPSL